MADRLHRSSSGNGSSQNITEDVIEADVRVTAALTFHQSAELNQQILDSSDEMVLTW